MSQLITSDDEINIKTNRKWYQNYKNDYKYDCVNLELFSASHGD